MVLNLRDIKETQAVTKRLQFTCHGQLIINQLGYRQYEGGFHDQLNGLDPQSDDTDYRCGYLDGLLGNSGEGTHMNHNMIRKVAGVVFIVCGVLVFTSIFN